MSITFTQGISPQTKPSTPSKPGLPKKPSFEDKRQEGIKKEQERLKKKLDIVNKKLKSITGNLRDFVSCIKTAQEPTYTDFYAQLRSLLTKLGINNLIIRNKIEMIPGQVKDNKVLYKVPFRRESEVQDNELKRMTRNKDDVEKINWTNKGMEIYLWAPAPEMAPTTTEPRI